MKIKILLGILFFTTLVAEAQNGIEEYLGDESAFYAATKQVNQFFRRFNGEENLSGDRYFESDSLYRDSGLRKKYLQVLYDERNQKIKSSLKSSFMEEMVDTQPAFLDVHGGEWFAEVNATFLYKGKVEKAILFLKLQEEKVGSKWVLTKAYFDPFHLIFTKDSTNQSFLHPLSHELSFMNLRKAFKDQHKVEHYAERDFNPDHLTLFLYEMKKGEIKFKTINQVKFHFFQLDSWYFQLSQFNRPGFNTGWLISDLARVTEKEKEGLLKFIYYEDQ
ncbi:MAG: hypothetical protein ACR2MX_12440 [Cyclobacteriaceae bacterium]